MSNHLSMERLLAIILAACFLSGCSGFPFKSEHYLGYSCEGKLAFFNSYCGKDVRKRKVHPDAAAWVKKSGKMLQEKNWSEAVRMASAAISIDPFYTDAYALRSWAYLECGFLDKALADAEQALQLDPENALALNNRALCDLRGGHAVRAGKDLHKACLLDLEAGCDNLSRVTDYYLRKAEEAFRKHDWDGVIKYTSEIPENEVAISVRCGAYANKMQFEKAMTDCDAAIKMNPNSASAYNNKGYTLELIGKKKDAALNYEFACNLKSPLGCANLKRLTAPE